MKEKRAADFLFFCFSPLARLSTPLSPVSSPLEAHHSLPAVLVPQLLREQQQQSRRCRCRRSLPLTRMTILLLRSTPTSSPAHQPKTRPQLARLRLRSPLLRVHACVPAARARPRHREGTGGNADCIGKREEGDVQQKQQRLDFLPSSLLLPH